MTLLLLEEVRGPLCRFNYLLTSFALSQVQEATSQLSKRHSLAKRQVLPDQVEIAKLKLTVFFPYSRLLA